MHQTRKFSVYLSNLRRRRVAASFRKAAKDLTDPALDIVFYRRRRETKRSYKLGAISFCSLTLLAGCGNNSPSNSDIIKQLSSQISPCPELSIVDFKKINGFPQTDGSYVDQIQYVLTFTPSDTMRNLLADYDEKKKAAADGFTDANNHYMDPASSNGPTQGECERTYQSKINSYSSQLSKIFPNNSPLDNGYISSMSESIYNNQQELDALSSNMTDSLQAAQQALAQNNFGPGQSAATVQQYIRETTSLLARFNQIKDGVGKAAASWNSCNNQVLSADQAAQNTYDQARAQAMQLSDQATQDRNTLFDDLQNDCPINPPGGVPGLMEVSDDPDTLFKTFSVQVSGEVHLVKSDNGWVFSS